VKLSAMGIAFGLVLGVFVAGGLEFLDDRLHSDSQIEDLLPVAIIGEIPEVSTMDEQNGAKRRLALGWTLAVLVVFMIVAGSAFNYMYANGSSIHLNALVHKLHV
jgi:ABC-type Na+ efflux pump permease subunit